MNMIIETSDTAPRPQVVALTIPAALTVTMLGVGLGYMVAPTPVGLTVVLLPALVAVQLSEPDGMAGAWAPAVSLKLAHVIRVLLAKWTTKLRLPKKAPMPS